MSHASDQTAGVLPRFDWLQQTVTVVSQSHLFDPTHYTWCSPAGLMSVKAACLTQRPLSGGTSETEPGVYLAGAFFAQAPRAVGLDHLKEKTLSPG
mmetsp:Transcript_22161/g.37870  ORF Transcript_22161/g.37870 Transcript_22161/m.37870 type:complete len:96 (-) Transcript_22161:1595-1882(-)